MHMKTLCRAVESSITTSYSASGKIFYRGLFCDLAHEGQVERILGDPGAVSRVDKMSVVKVYFKIETSPWALTLTKPVPEAFELPASDFFWPISEEEEPGDSDLFLHDVVFLIDRHSCVSRGTFQN